ncbi:helix-turn-helix domain-containing protein [Dactylosporangium sp. NPDC000244]|uniref:helix-turn-helix domain-containing protein n=1 Tax=Dactylosporangium sp. NPDC000244 TaxID=3154365 RepID=UPI0033233E8C
MNGLELLVLGRTLIKLGSTAMPTLGSPDAEMPASVRSVLVDVTQHPDSSIGEIAARTGFPQSHVSASIARLQEHGSVVTSPDPRDRRRTLVRPNPSAKQFLIVSGDPADDALLQALDDPRALPEVQAALRTLYSHLVRLP